MTQAAFELQRTDNKVIDVAHKYGYSSPTSFNRAFQSVHGIAPIAAKSMGCTLCAYPSIQFSIKVLGGSAMAYHIEEKKNIRIIGIRIPLVEDAEENMRNVPAFWKKAVLDGSISKLAELSNKNPDGILGVSVYNNPEDTVKINGIRNWTEKPLTVINATISLTTELNGKELKSV